MYNSNQKTKFIRENANSLRKAKMYETAFELVSDHEQELSCDVSQMNEQQLADIASLFSGIRWKSYSRYLYYIREYIVWTGSSTEAIDSTVHKAERGAADKIRISLVANPMHLKKCLDEICSDDSEETMECVYRCYYWLAYAGMYEDDILNVKCSDVDLSRLTVYYGGKEFEIYREAISSFHNAATLSSFVYKNPHYKKPIRRERVPGDNLIRGIRDSVSKEAIRVELSRRQKKAVEAGATNMKLSFYRVWLSGVFYRMYERERAGMPVDFSEVADEFINGKVYDFSSGRNTIKGKRTQVIADYQRDYERWKMTFST